MGEIQGRVEIKFDGTNWVDVSSYVLWERPFSMTSGRSDVYSSVQPGRLSGLVLDNVDGRFTVGNASGAYYPNVRTGRQIRVSIKDPASTDWYPRWTGRIDGWPISWEDGSNTCLVTVNATDMLVDLMVPYYWYNWVIRWRCSYSQLESWASHTFGQYHTMTQTNQDGSQADEWGGGPSLKYGGTSNEWLPPTEAPGPLVLDKRPVSRAGYYYGTFSPTDSSWGFAGWVKAGANGQAPIIVCQGSLPSAWSVAYTFPAVGIYFDATTGAPRPVYWNSSATRTEVAGLTYTNNGGIFTGTGTPNCVGKWLYVDFRVKYGGTYSSLLCYFWDGRNYGQYQSASVEASANLLANTSAKTIRLGEPDYNCMVGHVYTWGDPTNAGWNSSLGMFQGFNPYLTGSTNDAWDVVDFIVKGTGTQIPFASRYIPLGGTGADRLKIAGIDGASREQTALQALQNICTNTGAQIHSGRGGTLYYSMYKRVAATVLPVFTMSAYDISSIEVTADKFTLANKVTIENHGGAYVQDRSGSVSNRDTETDSTSVASVGTIAVTGTTYIMRGYEYYSPGLYESNTTSSGRRRWWEWRRRDLMNPTESIRIPNLLVDGLTLSNAQQLQLLVSDMWHRIRVTDLPTTGGMPSYVVGWIEGWTETLGVSTWTIKYNLSQAGSIVGTDVLGSAKAG